MSSNSIPEGKNIQDHFLKFWIEVEIESVFFEALSIYLNCILSSSVLQFSSLLHFVIVDK